MEEHRLKPMPTNYDVAMFNRLFEKTHNLRRKLARQIDHNRFGVTQEDIVSFFNTKFIFVFTRYYGMSEELLKANIIRALQTYKYRIMKSAYLTKNSQHLIDVDDTPVSDTLVDDHTNSDFYYEKLMGFMRDHLSENAYLILQVQLNPPPFILSRINPEPDANLQKIPDEVLLEYFDLGNSEKSLKYIASLKKEIKDACNYAKIIFRAS